MLVVAPFGRDAASAAALLTRDGYDTRICASLDEAAAALDTHTGVVLLTEEALGQDLSRLEQALRAQPSWSDVPFVLLAARANGVSLAAQRARRRLPDITTNVVVLERPLGSESLLSALASTMRARQKQFEMRDRLADLAAGAEALARSREDLERLVEARTAELKEAHEHLRQSQKMEAVGQLTGGIAHDFNNMLTGIIGALDIMRRRIAADRFDDLDRFMDAASVSAQRAANLTQRLLAFSRRQSLDSKPLHVNGLVRSLEDLIVRTIGERIGLKLVLGEALPRGVADANQLESAILNLVINARDAMPDGGTLTIETRELEAARRGLARGRYVEVAVCDTGVGMTRELLDKVFDPFFTTKPIGQGTGLGLSMVYGFARQSGGDVRILSTPGQGTRVEICLPVAADMAEAAEEPSRRVEAHGDGQAVLVVEDDPSVRMLVCEVLGELGYAALEAAEAGAAVKILGSQRDIDLMVSDVGLPDMNGRQLAEIARRHRPHLPILFVTGYAENAAIRSGFLGTNMAMIEKPFAVEVLAAKLGDMLGMSTA